MSNLWMLVFALVSLLPMSIALARKHHNRAAIGILNLIPVLLLIGSCTAVWIGSTEPGAQPDSRLIGGTVLLALVVGSPFWLGALIWSATAVRREPPAPAPPPPRGPRSTDDDEPPVYEIPPPPKRRR